METLAFRPISLSDCVAVRKHVYATECRNCDVNFMNLMSWHFLYETELAFHGEWLLFRFKYDGTFAYLPPVGVGDWKVILQQMIHDAHSMNISFRLMGVCESTLLKLYETQPGFFEAKLERAFSDYIYERTSLVELKGKRLQAKRNHIHKFIKRYPGYEYRKLTSCDFSECLDLVKKWSSQKERTDLGRITFKEEYKALCYSFEHWNFLSGMGGCLLVDGKIIAFTYGAPVNYDTFDVCVEKADAEYEGAFAMINREFARSLPDQYIYINREEDLGLDGLRQSKLSYQPAFILNKYTVKTKP